MLVSNMTKQELDEAMRAAMNIKDAHSLADLEQNVSILETGAKALQETVRRLGEEIEAHIAAQR